MTNVKHTSGPWRIDAEETRISIHATEDEAWIADCGDGFYNDSGEWVMAAVSEANACLIAAAPRMYDYIANCAQAGNAEAKSILEAIYAGR